MGQGAAQAIEDGAALAACLRAGADDPPAALRRYERLRLPRVTRLQQMSRANKHRFHMPDGPEQQARDAEWARAGDRSPDAPLWPRWPRGAGTPLAGFSTMHSSVETPQHDPPTPKSFRRFTPSGARTAS